MRIARRCIAAQSHHTWRAPHPVSWTEAMEVAYSYGAPPVRQQTGSVSLCGCGSVGRASPCQGEGRGFESRHPLGGKAVLTVDPHGGLAERRGNGLQSRVHGFESRTHLAWAIGAAGARFPDTEEVTGSIPVSPTTRRPPHGAAFGVPPPTLAYVRVEPEVPRTDVRTSG